jgi:ubiquinone/menaquinone biosynthesis C-methylase UbiE
MTNVEDVYQQIALHFDDTRFCIWNGVKYYLDSLNKNSYVLDCGTGNGKYIKYRNDIIIHGADLCSELLEIASNKYKNNDFTRMNALNLPYKNNTFDHIICVAMFHHLNTIDKRLQCLKELSRVCIKSIIITVWAFEQPKKTKWQQINDNDYLIPWLDRETKITYWRYYHLFKKDELVKLLNGYNYSLKYEMDNWIIILHL